MIHPLTSMTCALRLALLICTSICLLEGPTSLADERPFLMGLTPMNFDESPAGTERMKAALAKNADVVAIYLDWGVPWLEAFEGQPFHENVRKEIGAVKQRISPQHQVFLALNLERRGEERVTRSPGASGSQRRRLGFQRSRVPSTVPAGRLGVTSFRIARPIGGSQCPPEQN